mgnify:FL=1
MYAKNITINQINPLTKKKIKPLKIKNFEYLFFFNFKSKLFNFDIKMIKSFGRIHQFYQSFEVNHQ